MQAPDRSSPQQRYRPLRALGRGSFGLVIAAHDSKRGCDVAIKQVPARAGARKGEFETTFDRRDAKVLLRETLLLRHFGEHYNILGLRDVILPGGSGGSSFGDHLCFVTDQMDTDLHHILSKNQLSEGHIQYFLFQILRGLAAIHSAGVLHRDLKPANLLVNKDCTLRIADFGSARGVVTPAAAGAPGGAAAKAAAASLPLTEYVMTRWYRAPELLAGCDDYGLALDLWSVGCILGEMYLRTPIFPGRDVLSQIKLIVGALGVPSDDDLAFISNRNAVDFIKAIGGADAGLDAAAAKAAGRARLAARLTHASEAAIDLLCSLLEFAPSRRPSVVDALASPFVAALRELNDVPSAPPFDFSFETAAATDDELSALLWRELRRIHAEANADAAPRAADDLAAEAAPTPPETPLAATGSAMEEEAAMMPADPPHAEAAEQPQHALAPALNGGNAARAQLTEAGVASSRGKRRRA